tara:strand:+ start:1157 stop:1987 length:831 start_codon:yes stop_codon:yes gene_type:complete
MHRMQKIDGKQIAKEIIDELKKKPAPKKFLAAFLVGDDPASVSFINQKKKIADKLGVDFRLYKYPKDITNDEMRKEVGKVVRGKTCGGALIQLPLPKQLNKHYILNVIPREKDVDALGERALGAFYTGRNPVNPPAVGAIEKVLKAIDYKLEANQVAIVGSGLLVGKPIAVWLKGKAAGLSVFDKKTKGLEKKLKEYDLIISGTGQGGLIKPEMLKNEAFVIDFGYSTNKDGDLQGDFDASKLKTNEAISYTPTPGGTGPIVVAQLFENFYTLNES